MSSIEQYQNVFSVEGALPTDQGGEKKQEVDAVQEMMKNRVREIRENAGDFFSRWQPYLDAYMHGAGIPIRCEGSGWYVVLDPNNVYINADPNFFLEKGYNESESLWATRHEIEHFLDMAEDSDKYGWLFEEIKKKKTVHRQYPRALKRFINCLDDILVNNRVDARWDGAQQVKSNLYANKLFRSNDFSKQPKHRQLGYAFLREAMLPQEPCIVDPDVRELLKKYGPYVTYITGVASGTAERNTTVNKRLTMYMGPLEEEFRKLFEYDVEHYKKPLEEDTPEQQGKREKKEQGAADEEGEGAQGDDPGEEGEAEGNTPGKGEEGEEGDEPGKEGGKEDKGKSGDEDNEGDSKIKKKSGTDEEDKEDVFGKDPFEDGIPDPLELDDVLKQAKDLKAAWERQKKKQQKEEFEKRMKVSQVDYNRYMRDLKLVEPYIEAMVDNLERLMVEKTITKRRKVASTEGILHSGKVAIAYAETQAGNLEPEVFTDYKLEKSLELAVEDIEFTLVADGSGSMEHRVPMQRRIAIMFLESLERFQQRIAKRMKKMKGKQKPIGVATEVRMFSNEDHCIKKLSQEPMDLPRRVEIYKGLTNIPGQNNHEDKTMVAIDRQLTEERCRKLQEGKLKKVVIFLTDGGTNIEKVQGGITGMQRTVGPAGAKNMIIAGVGFGEGRETVDIYAPHGYYAEDYEGVVKHVESILTHIIEEL